MRFVSYLILWFCFSFLLASALLLLEYVEGYKITTTEYYGLRNLGFAFVLIIVLPAIPAYPILIYPLSLLIQRIEQITRPFLVRGLIMVLLWIAAGWFLFHEMYDAGFVKQYGLNGFSAVVIFGVLGLIYVKIEHFLQMCMHKRSDPSIQAS